ncbi:MAG: hypothetical protein ACRDJ9_06965 [Dehalococcoidia bacterium]
MASDQHVPDNVPGGMRVRCPAERRVLPYGGDVAVARSIAAAHPRNPWTGRCRSCGEAHPCKDRRDANDVLAHKRAEPMAGERVTYEPADWLIGIGIALCAVGVFGACTWRVLEALS